MSCARAIALCLALVGGCATAPRPAEFRDAERAYWAAEARMASEEFPDAIALFRRAAVALPDGPTYQDVRHDLVMRIAHTQLRAHAQTRDVGYLADAAQMLVRYASHAEGDTNEQQRRELGTMSRMVAELVESARREGERIESDPSTRYPHDDHVERMIAAAHVPTAAERRGVRPATRRLPGPLPVNTYVAQRGSDEWRTRLLRHGERR